MAGRPRKRAAHAKNAKPSGPAPCAVLWGLGPEGEKGAAVRGVLREMGVTARTVTPERLGDPAGALARLPGVRPSRVTYEGPAPDCEFVLLCGLTSKQIDEFLARSREAGCVVGPKAVLTKDNRGWPIVRLIQAVAAEHAANGGK